MEIGFYIGAIVGIILMLSAMAASLKDDNDRWRYKNTKS